MQVLFLRLTILTLILSILAGCYADEAILTTSSTSHGVLAPEIILPDNNTQFYTTSDMILSYGWQRELEENEFYNIRIWREGEAPQDISWTKLPTTNVSDFLETRLPGYFYWQVAVIATDEQGGYLQLQSPWSEVRTLIRIAPTPPPPLAPTPTATPGAHPIWLAVDPFGQSDIDINGLVTAKDASSVEDVRREIIRRIWESATLPFELLPTVEPDITHHENLDARYDNFEALKQIDSLTIEMDYGFTAIAYHFRPESPNGRLLIYHEGHDGDFIIGKGTIQFFLLHGYDVVGISMPGLDMYPYPESHTIPGMGTFPGIDQLRKGHEGFAYAVPFIGNGLRFFIEPTIAVLNYAESEGFTDFGMIGLSGGGWTTVVVAALDTRVQQSYPVAGTYPFYLRYNHLSDLGDWEQTLPGIAPDFGYLDFYVLGAEGAGRNQLAIYNQFDTCCFAGLRPLLWENTINDIASPLGGSYSIFIDDTHTQHIVSSVAWQVILDDLQRLE